MLKLSEFFGFPVKLTYSASPGGYPKHAINAFYNVNNAVVTQAVFIPYVIPIHRKGVAVILIQAIARPKPHESAAILNHTGGIAVRQALVYSHMAEFQILILREGMIRNQEQETQDEQGIRSP